MINKLLQYSLLAFAKLPFFVLYRISDILYILLHYIIRYRRKVVLNNFSFAFPNATKQTKKIWLKQFNKHLCDYAVESLKLIQITPKALSKRTTTENFEVFNQIKSEQKNIVLLCGHIFNWEYLIDIVHDFPQKDTYAVYHKVSNKAFDEILIKSRSKFGTIPLKMQHVVKKMLSVPKDGNSIFLFVADQRPHYSAINHDLTFFGNNVPVFNGYDKLARKTNAAVVYCDIRKTKRGHYQFHFKRIIPNGQTFEPNEIVSKYYKMLEENLNQDPSNWLWTHKRWKYTKGVEY